MHRTLTRHLRTALPFCTLAAAMLLPAALPAAPVPAFHPEALIKVGDSVPYGSYKIFKIGEGVFQINDPGVTTGKGGAWGTDDYLVLGRDKALLVDLGNNYIDGYAQDVIAPRPDAAEQFRTVVFSLAGKRKLEVAITHAHPDHDGMTGALANRGIPLWMPQNEDFTAPTTQHKVDPKVYTPFAPGKVFDLGGGRTVKSYQVRGHTNGSTVYLLQGDMFLFTGDALGSGFGQAFASVERLRLIADDSKKLVADLKAEYTPAELYRMRVYTGHWYQRTYGGWMGPKHAHVDVGSLDWRFVQNVASAANGIFAGEWLQPGSGLQYVGTMEYTDLWPTAKGRAIMVYGIGTIIIPLEVAYQAAGLKMPAQ